MWETVEKMTLALENRNRNGVKSGKELAKDTVKEQGKKQESTLLQK